MTILTIVPAFLCRAASLPIFAARVVSAARNGHYVSGGWRRTYLSPTGSGPEGSSPNDFGFGSFASLFHNFAGAIRIASPFGAAISGRGPLVQTGFLFDFSGLLAQVTRGR